MDENLGNPSPLRIVRPPVAKKKKQSGTPNVENRKARFQYHIHETLEVGIQLQGSEVKSVRAGNVSIAEGFVRVESSPPALFLHGVTIGEYGPAGGMGHAPTRTRKLLAHRQEIAKLQRTVDRKGVTIVPLKLYFKNGFAKLLVGVGEGKSRSDKRQTIAERDTQRDMQRAMTRKRIG